MKTGTEHWNSIYQESNMQQNNGNKIVAKGSRPQWSYHNKAYEVKIDVGQTEYMKRMGTEDPLKIQKDLNQYRHILEDSLKDGTTQNTHHIPAY